MGNSDDKQDTNREKSGEQEELFAYEKLFNDVKQQLEQLSQRIDPQALADIINKSTEDLKEIESNSREAVTKASEALKKDLASTAEHTKPLLDAFEQNASRTFQTLQQAGAEIWTHLAGTTGGTSNQWRDWTGGTMEAFFKQISSASGKLAEDLGQALTYKTGEITHGGTFKCVACGHEMTLEQPAHMPSCAQCENTEFRRA